ncbi:TrmB family transcriptional regulator [Desulfosporosinus sp. BICA1-9]|uniref:TrmB family transcriptional regulator n=1 Tax=Desulfosporosinus sp. BICA1-9 TaxID=1531958 RepID=UPI00054C51BE|nr:helix-turn-helix domain-containing protein [Desulfosporosinus sp. BICA1-9]KJS48341.1 MAG: TrmB family transcriptional regulator [Peptococcaceae bacterium BRH_c23]KJS85799.1 MAG: TrmB family transcriptional regulator [Desulfosporosinus sp. BICA1-9]HBW34963.1 TrmB family transcriptional regulator [Desulfosporosinus sp.]
MEIIELLMNFNLTKQDATIYLTLLSEGDLTGYEVAKFTGISRSNTYIALAGLVEKGAAHVIEGNAARYTPVPVDEFCDNKIRNLQEIRLSLIRNMPKQREENEGYITIKGNRNIINKITKMLIEAEKRVYISLSGQTLDIIKPQLNQAVSRGLKVVILTNPPFELNGATIYHVEKTQHQIRLIVDSANVLTGDIIDDDSATCLYSKKQNLIDLFKESLTNEIRLIELMK